MEDKQPSRSTQVKRLNKSAEDNFKLNKRLYFELDSHSARITRANVKLEEIETLTLDIFHKYLRGELLDDETVDPINAVNAYTKLVDAVCKREKIKLEYVDRIADMLQSPQPEEDDFDEVQKMKLKERQDLELLAEQMLIAMVTNTDTDMEKPGN